MKKLFILSALILGSIASFASDLNENIIIVSSANKKVVLDYKGFEDATTTVTIRDINGIVLYREQKNTPESLTNIFKFNELEGGQFTLVLENALKMVEADYMIVDGIATQLEPAKKTFKPQFDQKGDKLKINLLNPAQEDVLIHVLDAEGNRLTPSLSSTHQSVNKTIDFSKYNDEALVVVKVNGKEFYYNI